MSNVERFNFSESSWRHKIITGEYVKYSDYKAMLTNFNIAKASADRRGDKIKALEARIDKLEEEIMEYSEAQPPI